MLSGIFTVNPFFVSNEKSIGVSAPSIRTVEPPTIAGRGVKKLERRASVVKGRGYRGKTWRISIESKGLLSRIRAASGVNYRCEPTQHRPSSGMGPKWTTLHRFPIIVPQ